MNDKNGHALTRLEEDDFIVTRDGDTATIISCVKNTSVELHDLAITFILDNSASMFHSYDSLTKYMDEYLDSLPSGYVANAITFDNTERRRTYDGTNREQLFIAASEFTSSPQRLKEFWHSYDTIRTNLTPLYESMLRGLYRIIQRRKTGDSLRREVMIVVTDGADNVTSASIDQLAELMKAIPVTLFAINFNTEPNNRLFWLAKKTHGDYYAAGELRELQIILRDLRRDIPYSYKLVFSFHFRGAAGRR